MQRRQALDEGSMARRHVKQTKAGILKFNDRLMPRNGRGIGPSQLMLDRDLPDRGGGDESLPIAFLDRPADMRGDSFRRVGRPNGYVGVEKQSHFSSPRNIFSISASSA